jgi:hypothetical protein
MTNLFTSLKKKKDLFPKITFFGFIIYYSAILSTIMLVGGIVSSTTFIQIIINLFFAPIPIIFWVIIWRRRKTTN